MTQTDSPEHWLVRAEEARTRASQMNDPAAKAAMLQVAEVRKACGAFVGARQQKPALTGANPKHERIGP